MYRVTPSLLSTSLLEDTVCVSYTAMQLQQLPELKLGTHRHASSRRRLLPGMLGVVV